MAIKKYKKHAFSLVEVIISMIILMVVTTSMIAVLTSAKPRIEETTIQGQFICYMDDTGVYQWQSNNRTPLDPAPVLRNNGTCELAFSRKPAFYYIVLVGPGGRNSDGQVITKYITEVRDNLIFRPGKSSNRTDTTIENADASSSADKALAGSDVPNGLSINNISECYLRSAGEECPNNPTDTSERQEYCEIGSISYDGGNDIPSVIIHGCESGTNVSGIALSDFTKINSSSIMSKYRRNGVRVGLVFKDGSFMGGENSGTPANRWDSSKIGKIISTIPAKRRSSLINQFIAAEPGVRNRNGAVLVLW